MVRSTENINGEMYLLGTNDFWKGMNPTLISHCHKIKDGELFHVQWAYWNLFK